MKTLEMMRMDFLRTGIFGVLSDPDNFFCVYTLEHAYQNPEYHSFAPKIPLGIYTCVRGLHQLSGMTELFETFEVTNVPGHTGCLLHPGNTEAESSGCILLGLDRQDNTAILRSKAAFATFMKNLEGLKEFTLKIS